MTTTRTIAAGAAALVTCLVLGCPPADDRGVPTGQPGGILPGPDGPGSGRGDDGQDATTGAGGANPSGGMQPSGSVIATGAGVGGGVGGFPGGGIGGFPDGTGCDAFACLDCRDCAVAGPCNDLAVSCAAEPLCATALDCLTSCFNTCAGETFCLQQCSIPCNDGSGAVQAASSLLDCACQQVCGQSCFTDDFDECESFINTAPL